MPTKKISKYAKKKTNKKTSIGAGRGTKTGKSKNKIKKYK